MKISERLLGIIDALPLRKGMRVLEIGCGPGVAAREVAKRIGHGHVLAIDRSAKAILLAKKNSSAGMSECSLEFRQVNIEKFRLAKDEEPYDIAFAVRVGALDGRHPKLEKAALTSIAMALSKKGRLFIDRGNPLKEISLEEYRMF